MVAPRLPAVLKKVMPASVKAWIELQIGQDPFLNYLAQTHSKATARQTAKVFDAMGLPLPALTEWLTTAERGFIVFHPTAGVAIKGSPQKSATEYQHPGFTPRLGTLRADKLDICFYPGTQLGCTEVDVEKSKTTLAKAGYKNGDSKLANYSRLPLSSDDATQRFVAVLDQEAVITPHDWPTSKPPQSGFNGLRVLRRTGCSKSSLRTSFDALKQLRTAFTQAATGKQSFASFWRACEAQTQQGQLVRGWEATSDTMDRYNDPKSVIAKQVAKRYQLRCQD